MTFKLIPWDKVMEIYGKSHNLVQVNWRCADCGQCFFEADEHDCDPYRPANEFEVKISKDELAQ